MEEGKSSKVIEGNGSNLLGDVGQISAISVAACYVSGFVIVNAHLGKYGVRDYAAFTTDYLVAGALYALILGIFWFLIGKRISEVDELLESRKKKFAKLGATGPGWGLICLVELMASLAILLMFAAFIVSLLLFSYYNKLLFLLFGITGGLISFLNFVSTSVAETKRSKWSYLLEAAANVLIAALFFLLLDGILESVFFFFLFMVAGVSIFNDNSSTQDRHHVSQIIYTGIGVLVILAGSFSYYFYDDIRNSIGGGKPQHIRLVVDSEELPKMLLKKLNITDNTSSDFLLVAQSDKEIFLLPTNSSKDRVETIRINRELIKAIFTQPDPELR